MGMEVSISARGNNMCKGPGLEETMEEKGGQITLLFRSC